MKYKSFNLSGNLFSRSIGSNEITKIPFTLIKTEGDSFLFLRRFSNDQKVFAIIQIHDSISTYEINYLESSFKLMHEPVFQYENSIGRKSIVVKRILGEFLDTSFSSSFVLNPKDTIIKDVVCREFGIKPFKDEYSNTLRYSYFISVGDFLHRGYYTVDIVEELDTMIRGSFIDQASFNSEEARKEFIYQKSKVEMAVHSFSQTPVEKHTLDTSLYSGKIKTIKVFDFSLNDSNLLDFTKGKFLIDLWFIGCLPCLKSFPFLMDLENKFSSKKVSFIKMNPIDGGNPDKLKSYTQIRNIEKSNYAIPRIQTNNFLVNSYPSFVFIEDGVIIKKFEGFDETIYEELKAFLEQWTADSR
ncbi:MAG: hypothetical protein FGM41_05970 [Bacteroidetes bacterium]|nr:hypothetical protein [Bacteroidota bacterium]